MREEKIINKEIVPKLVYTVLLMFFCSMTVTAQTKQSPPDLPPTTRACEQWISFLDGALTEWNKSKETTLIIIVRIGNAKTTSRLSQKRIKTLKEYVIYRTKNLDKKLEAVFAESDGLQGSSDDVVEMYIEGKLYYSLGVPPGSDIPLRNCNP